MAIGINRALKSAVLRQPAVIVLFAVTFWLAAGEALSFDDRFVERMADAIYVAEGADKTRFPYGVKSIETNGDKEYARQITINSIRNNIRRWEDSGRPGDFISFMAKRWCPPSVDPEGNKNWRRNVTILLRQNKDKL